MSEQPLDKAPPDWELARILFCQNVKHSVICAKAGCKLPALGRRITREGWVSLRNRFNEQSVPQTISIAERGKLVAQLVATETHSQLDNLTKIPNGKNVDAAFTKASTLAKLADVSTGVFGEVSQPRMLFRIDVLNQARPAEPSTDMRDVEIVEFLGGGFTRLTKNGVSRIEDDRIPGFPGHDMSAKPPRLCDLPPVSTRQVRESPSEAPIDVQSSPVSPAPPDDET